MSNNYWLNLILLEELVNEIIRTYSKFIGVPYGSEDALADDMQEAMDNLYQMNSEYTKFMAIIQVRCVIASGHIDGSTVYALDSFEILKLM